MLETNSLDRPSGSYVIRVGSRLLDLSSPVVMGVVNVTPDSFYEGSRVGNVEDAFQKVRTMINEGVSIIDIGSHSTRPGATMVNAKDELARIIPVVEMVKDEFPKVPVSVDTFRASVAEACCMAGAEIVNDISGGEQDDKMFRVVSDMEACYVLSHMKGKPSTMMANANYNNMFSEILTYFLQKATELKSLGVNDIILDPGFGFSKGVLQNYKLLSMIEGIHLLNMPVMIGVSRKSMIYKVIGQDPKDALNGTTVIHTIGLLKKVQILRVHDVKEAIEVQKIIGQFNKAGTN